MLNKTCKAKNDWQMNSSLDMLNAMNELQSSIASLNTTFNAKNNAIEVQKLHMLLRVDFFEHVI